MTRHFLRPDTPRRSRQLALACDDRGSMPMLMLVVIVGLALSALLVPMIITQNRTTRFDQTRVQAIDAAQAGIDFVLGLIRAASNADASGFSFGDITKLPCGVLPLGTLSGNVSTSYTAKIEYFSFNPAVGNPASDPPVPVPAEDGTGLSPQRIVCTIGGGPSSMPAYARITSTGTPASAPVGSTAGRTLSAYYTFGTISNRTPGGIIELSTGAGCMDIGVNPALNVSNLTLQACVVPPIPQQVFVYRTDLTIQLRSSVKAGYPTGDCLVPAADGVSIQLSQCGDLNTPKSAQQWKYDGGGQFEPAASPHTCISNPQPKTQLTLGICLDPPLPPLPAWTLTPAVGAGAAALPQLLNYQQFGLCLNVTGGNPTNPYLINYPCSQNPSSNAVSWNEKFVLPSVSARQGSATGQIYTNDTDDGKKYCLTSPLASGGLVTLGVAGTTMTSCVAGTYAPQAWTVYNGYKALSYASKYQITDGSGLCLGLGQVYGSTTIDVETCTGATEQKWNADFNVLNAGLQNRTEK